MHELGIMGEVDRVVECTMAAKGLTKVKTVMLQSGELSGVVPRFLKVCYSAACYKQPSKAPGGKSKWSRASLAACHVAVLVVP